MIMYENFCIAHCVRKSFYSVSPRHCVLDPLLPGHLFHVTAIFCREDNFVAQQ
jgi:hypothetical protein